MTTEPLTNESLRGICKSSFDLAHFAIDLGRYMIHSGRETHIRDVIKEIRKHPDPNYVETLRNVDEIANAYDESRA